MVSMEAQTSAGARVLVVDDDPTVSDVVRRYLERAGFVVDKAADGPTALALAAERAPDLVVLDLMLPGMSGMDVCRRLRRMSDVPIVMLTALGEEADRVVGFETGADDYMTKPFSPHGRTVTAHIVVLLAITVLAWWRG
jgi:two-component system, OmpR family, response regulator ResD